MPRTSDENSWKEKKREMQNVRISLRLGHIHQYRWVSEDLKGLFPPHFNTETGPSWLHYLEMPAGLGTGRGPSRSVQDWITFLSHRLRNNSIVMIAMRSGVPGSGLVFRSPAWFSFTVRSPMAQTLHWERWQPHVADSSVNVLKATNHYESISQLPTAIPLHVFYSFPELLLYFVILRTRCLILIYHTMERE